VLGNYFFNLIVVFQEFFKASFICFFSFWVYLALKFPTFFFNSLG